MWDPRCSETKKKKKKEGKGAGRLGLRCAKGLAHLGCMCTRGRGKKTGWPRREREGLGLAAFSNFFLTEDFLPFSKSKTNNF